MESWLADKILSHGNECVTVKYVLSSLITLTLSSVRQEKTFCLAWDFYPMLDWPGLGVQEV